MIYRDELYHHGRKGQKWYQRLYQYKDGSLTALGRIHYGIGKKTSKGADGTPYKSKTVKGDENHGISNTAKNIMSNTKNAKKSVKKLVKETTKKEPIGDEKDNEEKKEKEYKIDTSKMSSKKSRSKMSDAQIQDRIKRLEMEKKLKDLEEDTEDRGKKAFKKALLNVGTKTLEQVGTGAAQYLISSVVAGEFNRKDMANAMFQGGGHKETKIKFGKKNDNNDDNSNKDHNPVKEPKPAKDPKPVKEPKPGKDPKPAKEHNGMKTVASTVKTGVDASKKIIEFSSAKLNTATTKTKQAVGNGFIKKNMNIELAKHRQDFVNIDLSAQRKAAQLTDTFEKIYDRHVSRGNMNDQTKSKLDSMYKRKMNSIVQDRDTQTADLASKIINNSQNVTYLDAYKSLNRYADKTTKDARKSDKEAVKSTMKNIDELLYKRKYNL